MSHHSHSGQFCLHARNTLEEMVQTAIRKNMQVYALTEHMPRDHEDDLYPEELAAQQTPADLYRQFDEFYHEAVRLREKYSSQIKILIGFETEWIRPSTQSVVEEMLQKYQFDLFVGSIHHALTIPVDFDRALYENARQAAGGTDESLFGAYFDAQFDMLQALRPPVVGHLDLIRLKCDEPDGSFQPFPEVWDKVLRNLAFIASYGGLLEINSSALRKGLKEPYPQRDVCQVKHIFVQKVCKTFPCAYV